MAQSNETLSIRMDMIEKKIDEVSSEVKDGHKRIFAKLDTMEKEMENKYASKRVEDGVKLVITTTLLAVLGGILALVII